MLKKLQSLKAKKGFTLVELIVVIAIIAVLAAILVPTMLGYVTSSRVTSADSTAASLKDTIGNAMVETDTKGFKVPRSGSITVTLGGTSADPTVAMKNSADSDASYPELITAIEDKIKNDYNFTKDFTAVVYLKDGKVVGCAYCADKGAKVDSILESDFTNGSTSKWNTDTDGIMDDFVVGTSPKLTKSDGTGGTGGTGGAGGTGGTGGAGGAE